MTKPNNIRIMISGDRQTGKSIIRDIIAKALHDAGYMDIRHGSINNEKIDGLVDIATQVADAKATCPDFVLPQVTITEMTGWDKYTCEIKDVIK